MSLSCSDRYNFQIKLHIVVYKLTAFHHLVNCKIRGSRPEFKAFSKTAWSSVLSSVVLG